MHAIGRCLGTKEMKNYRKLFKQLFSEFLGTFLYLCIVLSAGIANETNNNTVVISLANGLVVASIVQMCGHVSGGHINPAVTVGALVCGHIKPLKAVCFVAMQVLGSVAGSAVAYLVSAAKIRGNLGATLPYTETRHEQAFALEFLMTFLLVSVVLSVLDSKRGSRGLGSSPLAIGMCITGCYCASIPYTSSLNPVRSLGPAVMMGIYDAVWVYWAGPLSGGLVAGIVYRFFLGVSHYEYNLRKRSF
ncbi:aquaporin AQPAn.G-like [Spodoptera litura]|uniref:Aquaporin AQPAn.G-like n=1 Tax=Spodoptera litura TaxID=69820 RepID=A0A9J7EDR1_SPOLT|nr:aquaporin AQPAn.G-like [Spodoptera litura]